MKIVGRRTVSGIRYAGTNQDNHESKQRRLLGESPKVQPEEAEEDEVREAKVKPLFRERLRWTAISWDTFELACAPAIRMLVSKLNTYTEFNQQLILEFIAELRKLVNSEGDGAKMKLTATHTGGFLNNTRAGTFLRVKQQLRDGRSSEHVLPGGLRHMCHDAISRNKKSSNDCFFPRRKKRREIHD